MEKTAYSVEKKTPASDHALSYRVITCDKQTVARSGEINNFVMNHDQKKKIINHSLPTGYSNHHNTWEPENRLPPALGQEYFQESSLEKSMPTNPVFITRILPKEPSFSWRFYIPHPLTLLCIFILWSSFVTAQSASPLTLDLVPLYDCSQPQSLGIFGFPSLKNCSHTMLQQEATVSTFQGEVLRYSPVATTFAIYHCHLETITMTCDYDIFTGKNRYHDVKSVLLPGLFCLQAA